MLAIKAKFEGGQLELPSPARKMSSMQNHPLFRPGLAGTVTHEAPLIDSSTLAQFVGMAVDFHGVFASSSTFEDDLEFMRGLESSEPEYMRALFRQGQELTRLAATGSLRQIMAIVGRTKSRELLPYFTTKMFLEACFNGHVTVMRYMLQQGFDYTREPCKHLLHRVSGAQMESQAQAGVLQALVKLGYRVNKPAPPNGFTALHVAVAADNAECATVLISLGADVNAVADADVMPLTLAVAAAKSGAESQFAAYTPPHWQSKAATPPSGVQLEDAADAHVTAHPLVQLLLKAGAKLTWRADGSLRSPAQPSAASQPTAPSARTTTAVSTGVLSEAEASGAGSSAPMGQLLDGGALSRNTASGTDPPMVQPSHGMLSLVQQYKQRKAQMAAAAVVPVSIGDSPVMLFSFGSAASGGGAACPPQEPSPASTRPPTVPSVQEHADGSLAFSTD